MNALSEYEAAKKRLQQAKEAVEKWYYDMLDRIKTEKGFIRLFNRLPDYMKNGGDYYFGMEKVRRNNKIKVQSVRPLFYDDLKCDICGLSKYTCVHFAGKIL